jgi:AraC family transcriptional regulator
VISSSATRGTKASQGIEVAVRRFSGARGVRVIGGGDTLVGEHTHDWPVLSLYVMGDYQKTFDRGEARICGPSAVLHGAGEAHANRLFGAGLEQIDLQFDPRWLIGGVAAYKLRQIQCWIGGEVATAGNALAALWLDSSKREEDLARATSHFLNFALTRRERAGPVWLEAAVRRLQRGPPPTALELARQFGLHPTWLAQAYRASMGEGLRQTLQRRRVEYATMLLRGTELAAVDVAMEAGFCDQSHMSRAFRKLLGRTPAQVRAERISLGTKLSADWSPRLFN